MESYRILPVVHIENKCRILDDLHVQIWFYKYSVEFFSKKKKCYLGLPQKFS